MRHFPELPAPREEETKKKKKKLLAKARIQKADEVSSSEFAVLADRLGFQSEEILALKQRSSDRDIARDALLRARKPDRYEYNDSDLESHIEQIVRLFATAKPLVVEQSRPALVSDGLDAAGARCGFPDEEAHARDSKSLYITSLHAEREEQGESITSFYVRRSVYFAFFGRLPEISTHCRSSPALPPNASAEWAASSPFRETPAPEAGGGIQGDLGEARLDTLDGQDRIEEDRLEEERQVSEVNGNGNDAQEVDSFRISEREQRRGTQIDIERIIAGGLASIREDSEDRPASDGLEELVNSYMHPTQDQVQTENVDLIAHSQPREQKNLNRRRLQVVPPCPSEVRIEFKVLEGEVWRTDRSLLVDPSEPSEMERVVKEYMRNGIRPSDTSLNLLVPRTCFHAVTTDGTNTVLLTPEDNTRLNNQLMVFIPTSDAGPCTSSRLKRS